MWSGDAGTPRSMRPRTAAVAAQGASMTPSSAPSSARWGTVEAVSAQTTAAQEALRSAWSLLRRSPSTHGGGEPLSSPPRYTSFTKSGSAASHTSETSPAAGPPAGSSAAATLPLSSHDDRSGVDETQHTAGRRCSSSSTNGATRSRGSSGASTTACVSSPAAAPVVESRACRSDAVCSDTACAATGTADVDSPDAQPPPTPTSSPFSMASARLRQRQRQEAPHHVRFHQPVVSPAPSTSSASASNPSRVLPVSSGGLSAPPSAPTAADHAAMELLRSLSYAEVRAAQEWLASDGCGRLCDGDGGATAALLDATPATLDVAAHLRFAARFRALLGDEGDADDADDASPGACGDAADAEDGAKGTSGGGGATSPLECAPLPTPHPQHTSTPAAMPRTPWASPPTPLSGASASPTPCVTSSRGAALVLDGDTRVRRLTTPAAAEHWSLANFDLGRRIGHGHASKLFIARERRSRVVVALKVTAKDDVHRREGGSALFEEATRLQSSAGRHCPHIVRLYTSFSDAHRHYAVLEYAEHGDLASHLALQTHGRLPHAQARLILQPLVVALAYLHERRIVHRGVSLRSVLVLRDDADETAPPRVKLGDFAAAVQLTHRHARWPGAVDEDDGRGGSLLDYAPPEVVCGGGWSCKSDMWALGVVAFQLLCGYHPFDHASATEVKRRICTGAACYPTHALSHTAASFVRSLLCVAEEVRSSAAAALAHPFLHPHNGATPARMTDTAPPPPPPPPHAARREPDVDAPPVSVPAPSPRRSDGDRSPSRVWCDAVDAAAAAGRASLPVPLPRDGGTPGSIASLTSRTPLPSSSSSTSAASISTTGATADGAQECVRGAVCRAGGASSAPTLSSSSSASARAPLMSFALPTHEWQAAPPPPSVTLSAVSPSRAASSEEAEAWLSRRQSASNLKLATHAANRRSPTMTLSDVSASVLSVTRPPAALASSTAAADCSALTSACAAEGVLGASSRSCSAHSLHQHHSRPTFICSVSQPDAPATCVVAHGSVRQRCGDDAPGCSSVTVSSLTLCSAAGALPSRESAVSVSSSTISSPLSSRGAATTQGGGGGGAATGCLAPPPPARLTAPAERWLLSSRLAPLQQSTTTRSATAAAALASAAAAPTAASSSQAARPKAGKKKPRKTPTCALRLAFEALGDEDSW